jgi:glycosyltransferase involved in cell wall biosynthesis
VEHGENAWLVEPESGSAIAEGLGRLLADPALRRRIAQGALRTAQARDWNAVYERLIEQYRDAIERKGQTRAA